MIESFHFLRPWALMLLPVAALLFWHLLKLRDPRRAWLGVMDEHLLEALMVRGSRRRRVLPVHVLGASWLVGILALAGPSWQRKASPFAEDTSAIVFLVEVTETMTATDIQPSRLERAAQKIGELLEERGDARCALFAYAGSAHRAMPLTRDASVIEYFAQALSPEMMPTQGDAAADAVAAANLELARSGRAGSIILISDGVAPEQVQRIQQQDTVPVHVLAMGRTGGTGPLGPALDRASLESIARRSGGSLVMVTADRRDVKELARRATSQISDAPADNESEDWQDAGYWLLWPLAAAALFWSRRGWSVEWPPGVSQKELRASQEEGA